MEKKFCLGIVSLLLVQMVNAQQFVKRDSRQFFYADSICSRNTLWAEINGDNYPDLITTNVYNRPNQLSVNEAYILFPDTKNLLPPKDGGNSVGAIAADVDNDGDLDVLVYNIFGEHNYFYENDGTGGLRKVNNHPFCANENNAFGANFVDIDADGDVDAFIPDSELWAKKGSRKHNRLYINNGKGIFTESDNIKLENPNLDTRAGSWADYDNDGDLDVFLSNFGGANQLYENVEGNFFLMKPKGINWNNSDTNYATWGDLDNDGDQDLYVINVKGANELYLNNGDKTFTAVKTFTDLLSDKSINGIGNFNDYNADGYIDLYAHSIDKQTNVYYQSLGNDNNYLNIKLRYEGANHDAIGATVKVFTHQKKGIVQQTFTVQSMAGTPILNANIVHVGLEKATEVDSILVIWPGGHYNTYKNITANKTIVIEHDGMLYTYDEAVNTRKHEPVLKDLSVKMVGDSIIAGTFHTLSIFYQNDGAVKVKPTVKLQLNNKLQLRVGYPKPNIADGVYTWDLPELAPNERGIITLEFNVPANIGIDDIRYKATVLPIAYDENKDNNTEIRVQTPVKMP